MANEVRFDVVAKDSASKVVDDIADKAEKLEKSDPTVTVDADTRPADHSIDGFADQLDKLTNADKIVVLALRAGAAQTELSDLATTLATIDSSDPTVAVTFDRYAEVAGQLDDLNAKIKAVGDADPDAGASLETARSRLEAVGAEADKTSGAVHSMAGNAIGDFAATTTGIGPLGEAIGQLTELAADGETGIKGLATAGLGLGAISGGMFLVNKAMEGFADRAKQAAAIKAFNTADVDAYTASIRAGTSAVEDYIAKASEAGKIEVLNTPVADNPYFAAATTQVRDLTDQLAEAGVTVRQFATAAQGSDADLATFVDAVKQMGLDTATTNEIVSAATTEHINYGDALDRAAKFSKILADQLPDTSAQTAGYAQAAIHADDAIAAATESQRQQSAETARWQGIADQYAKKVDRVVGSLQHMRDATDDTTAAFDRMSGDISKDQSLIDLQNQLADVATAGHDAMVAQADADKARASGAKDADEKAAAAAQAMRDYETDVNNAKLAIIDIGQTAGATTVDVDSTVKKLDQGDLAGVAADAEGYYRRNPVDIAAHLNLVQALGAGLGRVIVTVAPAGASATTAAAPSTINVTQVLPRGWHGDALGEAAGAARRSGGLFQRARR